MQVTIYRIDSGFSNVCDGLSLRRPGGDAICSEDVYELPDGFILDAGEYGTPRILDAQGVEAIPCLSSNRPGAAVFLVLNNGAMVPVKKAKAPEKHIPLRDARIAAGLTQQQLADLSGVNVRQIRRVEIGEAEAGNLTAKNLLSLSDALSVDPHSII